MKTRIIKRTGVNGDIKYIIQQKHWLLRWMWADAWENSWIGADCNDSFSTLEEAKKNLCYFDESKIIDEMVL